jgi:hypothetical protein
MPLLFSYGTLQQENVQLSTFGRLLQELRFPRFFAFQGRGIMPLFSVHAES